MKGKKTGGRQKGSLNKIPRISKEAIVDLLSYYHDSGLMEEDFNALDGKNRMYLVEKFMQYIMPKMQAVTVNTDEEKPMTIEAKLKQLSDIPDSSKKV